MSEFVEFPKMARLSRDMIVTEKIDGTNGCVFIEELEGSLGVDTSIVAASDGLVLRVGSRTKWITPEADNFGFAKWCKLNAERLFMLGHGRHFGEWWGNGIQRGYGLEKDDKRFSLFNVSRWCLHGQQPKRIPTQDPRIEKYQDMLPEGVGLVPEIYRGPFDTHTASEILGHLREHGSKAVPGFMKPEGIVAYHVAGNVGFKKTIEKDDEPKSKVKS